MLIAIILTQTHFAGFSSFVSAAGEPEYIPYEYNHLTVEGGGFVSGVVFHPLEKDLMYIRTDVGGAYRWNPNNESWIPLNDFFGPRESNLYGIDGIALDPNDINVVYIAAGKVSDEDNAIFKSIDRGESWKKLEGFANARFQGNSDDRGRGERIAVDPSNSSVLYCGTQGRGLWKGVEYNGSWTWNRIGGSVINETMTVRNIIFDFDKNSGRHIIYAGVPNGAVYRSSDRGETWEALPNKNLYTVTRMEVGSSGALYMATTAGLWKFFGDTWTNISPSGKTANAYYGISLHPNDENKIVCVVNDGDIMHRPIFYTEDGGISWIQKHPFYLGRPAGTELDFSANTQDIKIDPYNPEHVVLTDWHGVYYTKNLISGSSPTWASRVKNLEEVVPYDLVAMSNNSKYRVITALADMDGHVYNNLDGRPIRQTTNPMTYPRMMSTMQIDFCEENQDIICRVGMNHDSQGRAEISEDGGETWRELPLTAGTSGDKTKPLRIAVSSKVNQVTKIPSMVLIQENKMPVYSKDLGQTWIPISGFPSGNYVKGHWDLSYYPLASDRVTGDKFYLRDESGYIYTSTDGGANWSRVVLDTSSARNGRGRAGDNRLATVITAPNMPNELWVYETWTQDGGVDPANQVLHRSTDGGETFTSFPNAEIGRIWKLGFGKEAPGRSNPTIYLYGKVNGVDGLYRSIDMGANWTLINNEYSKVGNAPTVVEGDRREFGIVYVGTNGRGIYYGKPKEQNDIQIYMQDFDGALPDWRLSNMTLSGGTLKSGGSGIATAICNDYNLSEDYNFSVRMRSGQLQSTGYLRILFNYVNSFNYNYIEFKEGSTNNVSIQRFGDEAKGSVALARSYDITNKDVTVKFAYKTGGYVSIKCVTDDGTETTLYDNVKLNSITAGSRKVLPFTEGRLGFETNNMQVNFERLIVTQGSFEEIDADIDEGSFLIQSSSIVLDYNEELKTHVIKFNITSDYIVDINCQAIVDIKDKYGNLTGVWVKGESIPPAGKIVSVPVTIPEGNIDEYSVGIYFWKSIENLNPLAESVRSPIVQ